MANDDVGMAVPAPPRFVRVRVNRPTVYNECEDVDSGDDDAEAEEQNDDGDVDGPVVEQDLPEAPTCDDDASVDELVLDVKYKKYVAALTRRLKRDLLSIACPSDLSLPKLPVPTPGCLSQIDDENWKRTRDSHEYAQRHDELSIMCTCACCGDEDSVINFVPLTENMRALLKAHYEQYIGDLERDPHPTARGYRTDMMEGLTDGVLPLHDKVCKPCGKTLEPTRKKAVASGAGAPDVPINVAAMFGDHGGADQALAPASTEKEAAIPEFALINGKYKGRLPAIFEDLSVLERSMISAISTVTLVELNGKFPKRVKKTYSIVNDITTLVRQIPHFISTRQIAILRHKSNKNRVGKDYRYRVGRIKECVAFIRQNNLAYAESNIDLAELDPYEGFPEELEALNANYQLVAGEFEGYGDDEEHDTGNDAVDDLDAMFDDADAYADDESAYLRSLIQDEEERQREEGNEDEDDETHEQDDGFAGAKEMETIEMSDLTYAASLKEGNVTGEHGRDGKFHSTTHVYTQQAKVRNSLLFVNYFIELLGPNARQTSILLDPKVQDDAFMQDINVILNPPRHRAAAVERDSLGQIIIERGDDHEFTSPFSNKQRTPWFWELAFPTLFPYGRGGMSDPRNIPATGKDGRFQELSHFTRYQLRQGNASDGRRMQQCTDFVFAAYHYETRRIQGGIVGRAFSTAVGATQPAAGFVINDITMEDLGHVGQHVAGALPVPANREPLYTNEQLITKVKHVLSRLMPYASPHQGSQPHIKHERNKLHAIVQSNVILSKSNFRWFVTLSPADVYQSRLYDVLLGSDIANFRKETCGELLKIWLEKNKETTFTSFEALMDAKQLSFTPLQLLCINKDLDELLQQQHHTAAAVSKSDIIRQMITVFTTENYIFHPENELIDVDYVRNKVVDELTLAQRTELLVNHPALAVRMFDFQQTALFETIILGHSKPFGDILDLWIRIEFQLRGSPHAHCLFACCNRDRITADFMTSSDDAQRAKVIQLGDKVMTSMLPARDLRDRNGMSNLCGCAGDRESARLQQEQQSAQYLKPKGYFSDDKDLRRQRFDPCVNLDLTDDNECFVSPVAAYRYRNTLLANQSHTCSFTCWKYNKKGTPLHLRICRFGYPRIPFLVVLPPKISCTIQSQRDYKGRIQVKLMPPSNNERINNSCSLRLAQLASAHGCNHDIQYISNVHGAVEYTAAYVGKAEAADYRPICESLVSALHQYQDRNEDCPDKQFGKYVFNALSDNTAVTLSQAVYFLLGLKIVKTTVGVESVNTLPRSLMAHRLRAPTGDNAKPPVDDMQGYDENEIDDMLCEPLPADMEYFGYDSEEEVQVENPGYAFGMYDGYGGEDVDETDEFYGYGDDDDGENHEFDGYPFDDGVDEDADDSDADDVPATGRGSVIPTTVNTHIGKRDAYGCLNKQQKKLDGYGDSLERVTLFSLLTHFTVKDYDRKIAGKVPLGEPPLFELDDNGMLNSLDVRKFKLNSKDGKARYILIPRKKPIVLNLTPFVPVDGRNERSCFSSLLLHVPWPRKGEKCLLHDCSTAVERFASLAEHNQLPQHLALTNERQLHAQEIYANQGNVGDRPGTDTRPGDGGVRHGFDYFGSDHTMVQIDQPPIDMPAPGSNGITSDCSRAASQYYQSYIKNMDARFTHEYEAQYCRQPSPQGQPAPYLPPSTRPATVPLDDSANRLTALRLRLATLNKLQKLSYDVVMKYVKGENTTLDAHGKLQTLLMFTSGEGGTGKTEWLKLAKEGVRIHVGKVEAKLSAAAACGPTGQSSANIEGMTWQKLVGESRTGNGKKNLSPNEKEKLQCQPSQHAMDVIWYGLKDCKLLILDEISMIGVINIAVIEKRITAAFQAHWTEAEKDANQGKLFGGLHVVFGGDFYQLDAINAKSFFSPPPVEYQSETFRHGMFIFSQINEFIELVENFRFPGVDNPLRLLLAKARIGQMEAQLLRPLTTTGTRHFTETEFAIKMASMERAKPGSTRRILQLSDENKTVDHINKEAFKNLAENLKADHTRVYAYHIQQDGTPPDSETELNNLAKTFVDSHALPYIDLAIGMRVYVDRNLSTSLGLFHGAQGTIVKIVYEHGESVPLPGAPNINQYPPVVFVEMDHLNYAASVGKGVPNVIPFMAQMDRYQVTTKFYRYQLPLKPANGNTVHKAQGCTAKHGVALHLTHSGFTRARGLAYVALSRATSIDQIYIVGHRLCPGHFTGSDATQKAFARLKDFYDQLRQCDTNKFPRLISRQEP